MGQFLVITKSVFSKEEVRMHPKAEEVKNAAMKKFGMAACDFSSGAIVALKNLDWDIPVDEALSQAEVADQVVNLDLRNCFGRVARSAAVLARNLPRAQVQYAEVWEDRLRAWLLDDQRLPNLESMCRELLMYEEPHAVVVVDGQQFDSISVSLACDISHPRVDTFPLWEGLASAWLVSVANQYSDLSDRLATLDQAEEICPSTTLVAESRVQPLMALGRDDEALELLADVVVNKRKTARGLYLLWVLTGSGAYEDELRAIYPVKVIKLVEQEVADAVAV